MSNLAIENKSQWMLWVSPSIREQQTMKSWPQHLQQRCLLLHTKNAATLANTLIKAINTGYYAMITIRSNLLSLPARKSVLEQANRAGVIMVFSEAAEPRIAQQLRLI
jgi:cell division inhibitor SulA